MNCPIEQQTLKENLPNLVSLLYNATYISEGRDGAVHTALLDRGSEEPEVVVVKVTRVTYQFEAELGNTICFSHPRVIELIGYIETTDADGNVVKGLVFKYYSERSMKVWAAGHKVNDISAMNLVQIALDATLGIKHFYDMDPPIIHPDLHSGNVLINRESSDVPGVTFRGYVADLMDLSVFNSVLYSHKPKGVLESFCPENRISIVQGHDSL